MLAAHLQSSPLIFPTFAKSLFNILVFGECKNQWALSRPLLALLLASEVVHKDVRRGWRIAVAAAHASGCGGHITSVPFLPVFFAVQGRVHQLPTRGVPAQANGCV